MIQAEQHTISAAPLLNNNEPENIKKAVPLEFSSKEIQLKSFFDECIELKEENGSTTVIQKLKGKAMFDKAAEYGIKIKRSALYTKCAIYIKALKENPDSASETLKRKEHSNKGTCYTFSNEALKVLQDNFVNCLVAKNAYTDMHDYFRKIATTFVDKDTSEEFEISNGRLVTKADDRIIGEFSSHYTSGVYTIYGQGPDGKLEVEVGSEKSAGRYLKEIKEKYSDALHLNYYGLDDFRNQKQHAMKLDYSKLQPNDLWVGDNKLLDVIIISEDWKSVFRPWLSGWYDMATRRYIYAISRSANADSVINSLVYGCYAWGLPKMIKSDNGKDFRSEKVAAFCKAIGANKKHATVRLPRAKPVESFHNALDQLCKSLDGYTSNKYKTMPIKTVEMLKRFTTINKDYDGTIKKLFDVKHNFEFTITLNNEREARHRYSKTRFMQIKEFTGELVKILDKYHNRLHRGLEADKLGKKAFDRSCTEETILQLGERLNTPAGRYDYKLIKGFKPVFAKPEVIASYAMNFELRTIQLKNGIQFNNEDYFDPKLRKYAGQTVLIRYTHVKAGILYVYHSKELQQINHKKLLSKNILDSLNFICIVSQTARLDYDDNKFIQEIAVQKKETSELKRQIGHIKPESNIIQLTGSERNSDAIRQAENELKNKNSSKPKLNFKWRSPHSK